MPANKDRKERVNNILKLAATASPPVQEAFASAVARLAVRDPADTKGLDAVEWMERIELMLLLGQPPQ